MKSKKRKVILHRIAKTEVKNYITPEKTVFKDVHITFAPIKYNWFTQPLTYPRWVVLLIGIVILLTGML